MTENHLGSEPGEHDEGNASSHTRQTKLTLMHSDGSDTEHGWKGKFVDRGLDEHLIDPNVDLFHSQACMYLCGHFSSRGLHERHLLDVVSYLLTWSFISCALAFSSSFPFAPGRLSEI